MLLKYTSCSWNSNSQVRDGSKVCSWVAEMLKGGAQKGIHLLQRPANAPLVWARPPKFQRLLVNTSVISPSTSVIFCLTFSKTNSVKLTPISCNPDSVIFKTSRSTVFHRDRPQYRLQKTLGDSERQSICTLPVNYGRMFPCTSVNVRHVESAMEITMEDSEEEEGRY